MAGTSTRVKIFIAFLLIFSSGTGTLAGQSTDKFKIRKGDITFVSNAELELITATTTQIQGVIDPANNQFAFLVPISSFKGFNSELQRIHFNEKYMESDRFPNATFTGKIIEHIDFTKDGTYEVRAKGDLDIHGQKQTRIIRTTLIIKSGTLSIDTSFTVPLADHNISIPTIVNQKIATEITVTVKGTLSR